MPEYIVIVLTEKNEIVSATFANSKIEADSISDYWNDEPYHTEIVPVDYSMRNE